MLQQSSNILQSHKCHITIIQQQQQRIDTKLYRIFIILVTLVLCWLYQSRNNNDDTNNNNYCNSLSGIITIRIIQSYTIPVPCQMVYYQKYRYYSYYYYTSHYPMIQGKRQKVYPLYDTKNKNMINDSDNRDSIKNVINDHPTTGSVLPDTDKKYHDSDVDGVIDSLLEECNDENDITDDDDDDDNLYVVDIDEHHEYQIDDDEYNTNDFLSQVSLNNITLVSDDPLMTTAIATTAAPITLDQLSMAFATNVSYFYLKNELQLSDTAMWRITYEASSVLGMTTSTIRNKVHVLQEMMNLTQHDIRTIIERQPTILHLSAQQNMAPTLLYLLRALDLGRSELRTIVISCPAILCYSISNIKSKIHFFTNILKYNIQQCREILLIQPNLLRSSVTTGLIPHYQFLMKDIELSIESIQIIVQRNPNILLYSLEDNLVPKLVYYMIMKLQMNTKQVHKLLLSYPQILNYNLDRILIPMSSYFIDELDFNPIEYRNIIMKFPRLITHSLRKVKRIVGYFRYELEMNPSNVKKVLYRSPAIMGLNLDTTIRSKVRYIQEVLNVSDDELHVIIAAMPSLLLLNSTKNIQPKIDYLHSTLQSYACPTNMSTIDEINHPILVSTTTTATSVTTSSSSSLSVTTQVREIVLRLPTLLGYSLEQRIIPRIEAIVNAGLHPSCITIGIPMTQISFNNWLQRRTNKYQRQQQKQLLLLDQTKYPVMTTKLLQPSSSTITNSTNPPILLLPAANKDSSIIISSSSTTNLTVTDDDDVHKQQQQQQRIVHWVRERRPPPPPPPAAAL